MAAAVEYTDEQLNYYRICCVTSDVLTEGLRTIFKQEWDNRYKATLGEWKDEPRNGMDFYTRESPRNQRRNAHLLATMINGDRAEWDCTMLFYAIAMAEITQRLKQLTSANEHSLSYLYISGNPGSGKSQLARLAAKQFYNEAKEIPGSTSFVMTLNAESPDTLLESYIFFARHLKCPEYAVTNTLNSKDWKKEEKITNLKTLVSTKINFYTSWLLVVDNVTNVSRVHGHLPHPPRGQLLITTQDTRSIPLESSSIQHISVSKGMKPHDACTLLTMLSGITDTEMEKQVAQVLDHQPLALASAASYVRQVRQNKVTSNFGWSNYLEKLGKGQRATTETILAETNQSYQKSMTAAITLAVEKVMTSDKVINHAFSFLSVCAPQPLSQEILINYILSVDEEINDKEMVSVRIQRCSLLLIEEEESGVYIRVHQVVHDVINSLIKDFPVSDRLPTVNAALKSFNQFIDENLSVEWNDLDSLVNTKHIVIHLETLIIRMENLFGEQEISQDAQSIITNIQQYPPLFQTLGIICQTHCAFQVAMKYFHLALVFVQFGDERNGDDMALAYSYMGCILYDLGEFHQAKTYLQQELAIRLKKLGPDRVDVAASYNNLATAHHDLGDLLQAKEYYDRALAIRLNKLGPEHVDVAASYNNLATVHHDLSDLEQGKEFHDRALTIISNKLGPQHIDFATSCNNLAIIHRELGELEQAKDYHNRALNIRLNKLCPDHVDVAASYNNLANVHHDLGDLEQAKNYHDRALAIRLNNLGNQHVDVATSYNNLATVHHGLGDLELAKKYYDHALTIRLNKLVPEHADVATSYYNLSALYHDMGDLECAKKFYDRALAIRLRKLGPKVVKSTTFRHNLVQLKPKILYMWKTECTNRMKRVHDRRFKRTKAENTAENTVHQQKKTCS